jgi:hypothetical protein
MPPSRLSRCIVPPNKLVKTLNWKNPRYDNKKSIHVPRINPCGYTFHTFLRLLICCSWLFAVFSPMLSVLLALNITDSSIGVSYASIPKSDDGRIQHNDRHRSIFESYQILNEVQRINPIQYMPSNARRSQICRRDETLRLTDELYDVSMDVKASGFLVSWPITTSGKIGKDCGKVLHVLDALVERLNGPAMSPHRPCSLWDFDRSRRDNLLCRNKADMFAKQRKTSPITKTSCLVSEKMAQKLLGRQQRELLEAKAATRQLEKEGDESDLAAFVLQEFINLNWKPLQSQLTRRDAEAQLVRNRRLNDTFAQIDEPDKAQLQLLM